MTDTATPFPAPDAATALEPGAPEDVRPLIDEQLKLRGELAELGRRSARAVVRDAESETPPPAAETALAYTRVSRAVRLCIMLQGKLLEARDEEDELQEMFTPVYRRKARVEKVIERIAEAEAEDDDTADALIIEAGERLDDEDLYGDLMERPMGEIVARLCKDLGLEPDWSELSQELWARREATTPVWFFSLVGEGDPEGVARACGGGAACPLSHEVYPRAGLWPDPGVTAPPPAGEPA